MKESGAVEPVNEDAEILGICTDNFVLIEAKADRILHFPGYHRLFVPVTLYRAELHLEV